MWTRLKWLINKLGLWLKLTAVENYYNEAESLIIWYAVSFAFGCAFYFVLPLELPIWAVVGYLEAVLLLLYLYRNQRPQFKLLTYVGVFALGLCIAKGNALYQYHQVESTLPEISYLRGKISNIDYGRGKRQRILLTEVDNFDRELKGEFRISVTNPHTDLSVGQCIELVAKLPQGYAPDALSNYNLERTNFYKGISATGYSISPIFTVECPTSQNMMRDKVNSVRERIKNAIDNYTSNESKGIIQAVTVGERSLISEQRTSDYRTAGLAHFLAISGMHMGMIALLVFFLVRVLLSPLKYGKYDLRKPSAGIAFFCTLGYYLISGQSVSCTRAFIMTSLIMFGVLVNRRTISFRLWAFAIIVVLCVDSVAVVSPGFLMSFGAVLGLVAFYEKNMQKINGWFKSLSILNRIITYILGILLVDIFAGLMTIPYSIYFFKQISIYTCLGNLLAAPIIAFWVMPSILLFFISLPFNLEQMTLPILDKGVGVINELTAYVASLPLARAGELLSQMSDISIFLITIGLLWLCIWQARWRYWGLGSIFIGLGLMFCAPQPDFVFDNQGETFAYRQGDKLQASCWHKNKFLERMWTDSVSTHHPQTCADTYGDNDMICNQGKCYYRQRIEFSKGKVILDKQNVPLHHGGFIDLKRGIYYRSLEQGRLWNKKAE